MTSKHSFPIKEHRDVQYADTLCCRIYNRKSAYLKEEKWTSSGGVSESLPMLIDPDIHHKRRKLVNPIFSPKYIELVAPLALQIIKNALSKAVESHQNSTPLHIQRLYMGITGDVIMQVCFDNQLHLIESTEEDHPVVRGMYFFEDGFFLTQHFPILINAMEYLPTGVANMLLPGYTHFRKQCAQWIEDVRERHHNGALYAKDGRKILFDLLLRPSESEDPSDLPPLTSQVLIDEANAFCLAGTLTTSVSLSLGTYFLLRDPLRRQKLLDELKDVPRNVEGLMEYRDVSKLPYLVSHPCHLSRSHGLLYMESESRLGDYRPPASRKLFVFPLPFLGYYPVESLRKALTAVVITWRPV